MSRAVKESTMTRVVTLFLVLALTVPAAAQDDRLEAARKEGKVVWYTSLALTSAEKVAKLFEAKYPGVKVEVHRTGSRLTASSRKSASPTRPFTRIAASRYGRLNFAA
jgi:ABC-type glycerol-3-phosphate transport system substrate-binding protein